MAVDFEFGDMLLQFMMAWTVAVFGLFPTASV